jgi:DNA-binding transcriptional LysR family regulator
VAINWDAPELLVQKRIASDSRVCVMHERHELATRNLTLKRFVDATHVLVAPLGSEKGVIDLELEKVGLKRHVCASVPAFSLINEAVLGHSRITTLPSVVAEALVEKGPFVMKQLPLKVPAHSYFALWHPRFTAEPRMRWILQEVVAALT